MLRDDDRQARLPNYAKDHPLNPSPELLVKVHTALLLFEQGRSSAAMDLVATNKVRQWQNAMKKISVVQARNGNGRVRSKHA